MMEVSVQPAHLAVGEPARLAVRFTNTGSGLCMDIVCRLVVPSGISLIQGRSRVEIPAIPAGETHVHEITVEASRSGEVELGGTSFSYQDQYGVSQYPGSFRCRLTVAGGLSPRLSSPRPVPSPEVWLGKPHSVHPVGTWDTLEILVRNTSDIPLGDVAVDMSGPVRTRGPRQRMAQLAPSQTARYTLSVIADEGGQVPVTVRTVFTYPDGVGSVCRAEREVTVHMMVARSAEGPAPGKEPATTILFLTASPQDAAFYLRDPSQDDHLAWQPQLQTGRELRRIEEELKLLAGQNRYRLKSCPAVRWADVNRALLELRPQYVHFSGHGDMDGNMLFENDSGDTELMEPKGLAGLFRAHRATVKCVIVNACYSENLAREMAKHIDYVVGMRWKIGDEAAVKFSTGFYQGLFAGRAVPDAFELGVAGIHGPKTTGPEHRTPLLLPES